LLASLRIFQFIVILVAGGVAVFICLVSSAGVARDKVLLFITYDSPGLAYFYTDRKLVSLNQV